MPPHLAAPRRLSLERFLRRSRWSAVPDQDLPSRSGSKSKIGSIECWKPSPLLVRYEQSCAPSYLQKASVSINGPSGKEHARQFPTPPNSERPKAPVRV